ncbi:DUF6221 family protein [Nonomuraea sp. NPDC049269]|uniref:DUF6221 family protein n=1 Tax=Nonomuraea sp. NPDC049269 TaxID=3364349 RepID=UPI003713D7DA
MDEMLAFLRCRLAEEAQTERAAPKRRLFTRITASDDLIREDETHGRLLRHLAAEYANHRAYREEWRP